MEPVNQNQQHEHNPHKGIFALLILAIILLLGIFGVFIYGAFFQPEEEIVPSELEQAMEDSLINKLEKVKIEEVIVEQIVSKEYVGDAYTNEFSMYFGPSFNYPIAWNAVFNGSRNGVIKWMISLDSRPILIIEGETIFPVTGTAYPIDVYLDGRTIQEQLVFETEPDLILSPDKEKGTYEKISESQELYIIKGRSDFGGYEYEEYILFTETEVITFTGRTELMTAEEWDIIKTSIDFSRIK